jgi:hypothetical protein
VGPEGEARRRSRRQGERTHGVRRTHDESIIDFFFSTSFFLGVEKTWGAGLPRHL